MITTLTLNPCIDHTIEVNGMEIRGTNRIKQVKKEVGGKGINVCTALVQLGYESETLLFIHEKEAVSLMTVSLSHQLNQAWKLSYRCTSGYMNNIVLIVEAPLD